MGDKLKLNQEQMRTHTSNLKGAIIEYKNFAKNPFDNEIGYLEGMNTDFLAKLKTMLENLNDSNTKVIKSLEDLHEMSGQIVENFQEVDQSAAKSLGIS